MNVVELYERLPSARKREEHYRNYRLVCESEGTMCIGEIYKQGVRVAYCESLDLNAAQQHLRRIVDWHIKDAVQVRGNASPKLAEWEQAILECLESEGTITKEVLHALCSSENNTCGVSELAKRVHAESTSEIYLLLADFSRHVCDSIPYEPPCSGDGRDPYLALICDNNVVNDGVTLLDPFACILARTWP